MKLFPQIKDSVGYVSGSLYWLKPKQGRNRNKPVGCRSGAGYLEFTFDGNRVQNHRYIFWLFNGYLPDFIDHINGNKLDNRIENLRPCTRSENAHNSTKSSANTSGVKNVNYHKSSGRWEASIFAQGKKYFVGLFSSLTDAEMAVAKKRTELHGEFARAE